jgi:hypothetical protein
MKRLFILLYLVIGVGLGVIPARAFPKRYAVPKVNRSVLRNQANRALVHRAHNLLSLASVGAVPSARTVTLQNAAVATGNGTPIEVAGMALVGVYVTITGTATVAFEGTVDRSTWFSVGVFPYTGTGVAVTSTSSSGAWIVPVGGLSQLRTRVSSRSSGSITAVAIAVPVGSVGAVGSGGGGGGGNVVITSPIGSTTTAAAVPVVFASDMAGYDSGNGWINVSLATALSSTLDNVRADQGVPGTIANSWPVEVTDGTNILGTASNPFRTNPTGTTTQPVSVASLPALTTGSAVIGAVTQSGVWTVQPGNTANTTPWLINQSQWNGTTVDSNSGSKSAGTLRVVLATDQPQLTNKLLVTPDANSAVNVAQVNGTATDTNSGNKSAGTQRMVLATDQPNLTTPLNILPQAGTAGGAIPYFYEATGAANQDATVLKGSAGQLYTFTAYNTTTSLRYVWIYNAASGVTSASTVVYCLVLPGFTTGSGAVVSIPVGMVFSTGISFRITTGFPGSNTGAATTGDVFVSAAYQ